MSWLAGYEIGCAVGLVVGALCAAYWYSVGPFAQDAGDDR
jgi:hypothetical protein